MECNPEDISKEMLSMASSFNINRLSIGIQSFNQDERQFLGRQHNNENLNQCLEFLIHSPIKNINIDLIYGLPISTLSHLTKTLNTLKNYPTTHVSTYALSIENGTQFEKQKISLLDNEKEAEHYQYIKETLDQENFEHYEIAAFAKAGHQCIHNLSYWNFEDYIGLGPSAHSFLFPYRFKNPSSLSKYIKNPTPQWKDKKISPCNKKNLSLEFFCSTLRLKKGFNMDDYKQRFNETLSPKIRDILNSLQSQKLIKQCKKDISCTKKGHLLLNDVLLYLTENT